MWLIVAHIHTTLKGFKSVAKCEAETVSKEKDASPLLFKKSRKVNHFIQPFTKKESRWFSSMLNVLMEVESLDFLPAI